MLELLAGLGLVLLIEGACYALFPISMRRLMVFALRQPLARLRILGLFVALLGLGIVASSKG